MVKNFFVGFFKFLKTKLFFKNLGLAAVSAFVFVFMSLFFVDIYTHHGEANSVPNFKGLTLAEAMKIADEKDLNLQVIDSVFSAPGKRGAVVEQTPPANFKVKSGRTIFITIKTFNEEKISMPNLKDVSIIQAKADMETYGLKLGRITYQPYMANNYVLEQLYNGRPIPVGTLIEKGSKIDLILGKSEKGEITTSVPNLIGLTKAEAEAKLMDMFLNVGSCIFDKTVTSDDDSLKAYIYKQKPAEDATVLMGSTIDVWLTLDKKKMKENK